MGEKNFIYDSNDLSYCTFLLAGREGDGSNKINASDFIIGLAVGIIIMIIIDLVIYVIVVKMKGRIHYIIVSY